METGIRYEWYCLQRCAATYHKEFEKEKIICQEMVQESCFLYDYSGYYCIDTGRIITGSYLKYLLAIFNSKVFFYCIKTYYGGGGLGETGVRMKHTFFEKCPIPIISKEKETHFIELIDLISRKKESSEDTSLEEHQIDMMVYKLYELTYDEVLVVDPDTPISRGEYDQFKLNIHEKENQA